MHCKCHLQYEIQRPFSNRVVRVHLIIFINEIDLYSPTKTQVSMYANFALQSDWFLPQCYIFSSEINLLALNSRVVCYVYVYFVYVIISRKTVTKFPTNDQIFNFVKHMKILDELFLRCALNKNWNLSIRKYYMQLVI